MLTSIDFLPTRLSPRVLHHTLLGQVSWLSWESTMFSLLLLVLQGCLLPAGICNVVLLSAFHWWSV